MGGFFVLAIQECLEIFLSDVKWLGDGTKLRFAGEVDGFFSYLKMKRSFARFEDLVGV
jgi:hypothetical protein